MNSKVTERGLHRLQNGDHLRREEFERRYHATPEIKKAELIEGIVYVHEPVRCRDHGEPNGHLIAWLGAYSSRTPGTRFFTDATLRLDDDNEPQPDGALFIDPALGGQASLDNEGYLTGAPELAVEVSASTVSYDLHSKLRTYRRAGVREYLVARMLDREVDWFSFAGGETLAHRVTAAGVLDSSVFPGLRLDVEAFFRTDLAAVLRRLDEGLGQPDHRAFVDGLRARGG